MEHCFTDLSPWKITALKSIEFIPSNVTNTCTYVVVLLELIVSKAVESFLSSWSKAKAYVYTASCAKEA